MKTPWEDLVNKGSNFMDFVRFRAHTYTRTQQLLPPLWAAIITFAEGRTRHGFIEANNQSVKLLICWTIVLNL